MNVNNKQVTPNHGQVYHDDEIANGWYDRPFTHLNVEEAYQAGQTLLSGLMSKYRKKNWFYFFLFNHDYLIAGALFNGGYYSETFVYLYDRLLDELIEFQDSFMFNSNIEVADNSINGYSQYFHNDNIFRITSTNYGWNVYLNISNTRQKLIGNLELFNFGQPLVNVRNINDDRTRLVYTHQNSFLKGQGNLTLVNQQEQIDIEFLHNARGGIDYTLGFHSMITDWYWASAIGLDQHDNEVAINFARDINQRPGNSNNIYCYWIGKNIYRKFEDVSFTQVTETKWRIHGPWIDLIFTKEIERSKQYYLGPIGYRYRQPIGRYQGKVLHNYVWTRVELFGVFEEHYAVW